MMMVQCYQLRIVIWVRIKIKCYLLGHINNRFFYQILGHPVLYYQDTLPSPSLSISLKAVSARLSRDSFTLLKPCRSLTNLLTSKKKIDNIDSRRQLNLNAKPSNKRPVGANDPQF